MFFTPPSPALFVARILCLSLRRALPNLLVLPIFLMGQAVGLAQQGTWPTQAVRIVVPFYPGGGTDFSLRAILPVLQKNLGVTIVVENRPGAYTITATELVAKSPADGYTWGVVSDLFALNPATQTQLPYRTPDDFQLVSLIGTQPYLLFGPSGGPPLDQLIASARSGTGLTVGTMGGTFASYHALAHIAGQNRLQITYVAYQHIPDLLKALRQGYSAVGFSTGFSGRFPEGIKILAVTGSTRNPRLPDAPTLGEAGLVGADQQAFYGIIVPQGTPQPVVSRIRSEVQRALGDGDVVHKLQSIGIVSASGVDFASFLQQSMQRYASGAQARELPTAR